MSIMDNVQPAVKKETGKVAAITGIGRDRALPGDHRPDVLRVKAQAQGGRAQAGGLILPRGQE